jgi:hypothetical protein
VKEFTANRHPGRGLLMTPDKRMLVSGVVVPGKHPTQFRFEALYVGQPWFAFSDQRV